MRFIVREIETLGRGEGNCGVDGEGFGLRCHGRHLIFWTEFIE